MKAINENDVLKESIVKMENKFVRKLFLANKKVVFKNAEIETMAKESVIANNKLSFQYKEKVGLTAELIKANEELAFQYEEKEKRAAELVVANIELDFQNKEKEKRASELLIANKKLIFKTQERQIKTAELNIANRDLKKAEEKQREYIKGLEEMMFITSHKVRQPIANILGFSNILDQTTSSPEELKQSVACIKEAAIILDVFTRELTTFICELGKEKKITKE